MGGCAGGFAARTPPVPRFIEIIKLTFELLTICGQALVSEGFQTKAICSGLETSQDLRKATECLNPNITPT